MEICEHTIVVPVVQVTEREGLIVKLDTGEPVEYHDADPARRGMVYCVDCEMALAPTFDGALDADQVRRLKAYLDELAEYAEDLVTTTDQQSRGLAQIAADLRRLSRS